MKLRSLFAFASVAVALSLHAGAARADDSGPLVHRSPGAYAGGIVLISVGSFFVTAGTAYGVAMLSAAGGAQGGAGQGPLVVAAVGSLIAGGLTVVGVATLVPGIWLVVKHHPGKREPTALPSPVRPPERDARLEVPVPRFVGVPILSGSF